MTEPHDQRCGTCKFWCQISGPDDDGKRLGDCNVSGEECDWDTMMKYDNETCPLWAKGKEQP